MLKIKKIFTKKIKYPLSLRGLFPFCHSRSPFCHSREGGNPSSQSLRSDQRNFNLSGFSLIELMVAVAILSMVIFGIFLAFSTGFQGIADARDRTEAVNYIQKTLEEYKNTPFNKIIDKPMRQIDGTKFSNGSIVIDVSEPGTETRLKKIITQVRWSDRSGQIKIEETSTLIYSSLKTGEILSANDIVLYASPYFRILPNTSTDLYAEIHDANGNVVTNESYTINFTILSGDTLGYLDAPSANTINGVASVKFYSNPNADGSVSIQASVDLDDDGSDDAFDTITITISTGAEGIILVPVSESAPVGDPVEINLYVVDASFDYLLDGGSHIVEYDVEITLSASGPGTLSTTTISAPAGTANFTVNSTGIPGTVEITASTPDLDLGYTEVTFTGGAQFIRLTPINSSIYEGESIEITIAILDENLNQTPFTGSISITSDNGGTFDPISPIEFVNQSVRTVNFSHNVAAEGIVITATCDGLIPDSIYVDVLESLIPSYIELTAIPVSVEANDSHYSFITATVYDDSDPSEIVSNYTASITFSVSGDAGYFLDGEERVYTIDVTPSSGQAYINLYSSSSGTATVTVISGGLDPVSTNINFYSPASYILLTTNSDSVVANGEDYAVITATVYDSSTPENIVTNYLYDIIFSVSGVGYFGDESTESSITPTGGIAQINLYSNYEGTATVDASSTDESQPLLLEADAIDIEFTPSQEPEILLLEATINAYDGFKLITFEVEVTNANLELDIIEISWSDTVANLNKIEIASPTSEMDYDEIYTGSASYPGTTVSNVSKTLLIGNSTFRLTFDNNMNNETINITLTDEDGRQYTLSEFII